MTIKTEETFDGISYMIKSKELPGLFLAGSDLERLREDVPAAVKLLQQLNRKNER